MDREEWPDIDAVYMAAYIAMTGSGGWSLTVLMTPDQKPFWAGTYLPKSALLSLLKQSERLGGKSYLANDYVFKGGDGHPYDPGYISKAFAKLLKRYNLPQIRFHELRHSCASLLLNAGFTLKGVRMDGPCRHQNDCQYLRASGCHPQAGHGRQAHRKPVRQVLEKC